MRLSGKLLAGEVGRFMQAQGNALLVVPEAVESSSAYDKAAMHLLAQLSKPR